MLATAQRQERMDTLVGITNTLDKIESIEIPKGSTESTTSFLQELFKGNYEQRTSKVRNS